MSVQHSERCGRWRSPRCGHDAVVSGRFGIEGRSADQPSSFLGQLGGLHCHGSGKHPDVAALIIRAMRDTRDPPTLVSALPVAHPLVGVEGFVPPSWDALANGQRPPRREPEEFEPGGCRHGWQHEAASRVERQHRGRLMPCLPHQQRAMLRSQSGPLAGVPLSTTPCNFLSRIDSHLFRVLLLRPPFTTSPLCTSVPVWPSP